MLDATQIVSSAEEKVGISDTEKEVGENLRRLLASLNEWFGMSGEGEAIVEQMLIGDTVNRLESLKWSQEHPEILDEPLDAPVFLMGLPRSGTTYFQYLFDRDDRFRLIRTWESLFPSPPPGSAPESIEPRREAWREIQRQRPHFEGFDALHLYDEDGSDECHAFLEQSFGAVGLHNLFRVPDYFDYLLDEADLALTYRIHARQLRCLQWRGARKPWALKYPNHVIAMNEILEVHPGARFLMTHRDPVQTLASICKMTFNLRAMRAAAPVDRHDVGRDMLHFVSRHVDRIMTFDAGPESKRVVHVDYYSLVADPIGEMRSIHRGLGIDTPDHVEAAVRDWHAKNPKNARGRNDYALAEYGLEEAPVAERFGDYMRRFGIPREREGLARVAGGPA